MNAIIREIKAACGEKYFFHTWESEGDMGQETEDGVTLYTEFETEMPLEEVRGLLADMRDEGYGSMACGHMHDCCGCTFLSHWRIFSTDPGRSYHGNPSRKVITRQILVKEVWSRNI